ncbi:MAG: 50S ribosomal protein L25/general stress protein Ctc [Hyphomicrobiaceae bacterium]|nr:50S ribosomal protein L25/general stress protein Ctc [Hyphomicrobiaceae bacterium]
MADVVEIKATARPRAGKGAARAVRREGRIPAVIYGEKQEPETIALDANELWKIVQKGRFLSTVLDIDIDGAKRRVLPRDVQLDPVMDTPLHVDFQRVGASDFVRVVVPVRFVNEALSPGLKRGGVLNIVRHEVEVTCPPDRIPAHFVVDLEGLEIGRSIHISSIKLPEGVRPTILNRDFTVATIAGKKVEEERAAEGAAPAEPVAAAEGGEKK